MKKSPRVIVKWRLVEGEPSPAWKRMWQMLLAKTEKRQEPDGHPER